MGPFLVLTFFNDSLVQSLSVDQVSDDLQNFPNDISVKNDFLISSYSCKSIDLNAFSVLINKIN